MLSEVVQPLISRYWELKSVNLRIMHQIAASSFESKSLRLGCNFHCTYRFLPVISIMSKSPWSGLYVHLLFGHLSL